MKRKITELEEKLQTLGFRLESKTYSGKHSQFSEYYIYGGKVFIELEQGERLSVPTKVYLDKSRTKVVEIKIENFIDTWCGDLATKTLRECYERVNGIIKYWENNNETSND